MIEEIAKNIFRIGVSLPRNPLREVNCYFIRGDNSDLLIDTGFRRPECRAALKSGLEEIGADRDQLDVAATHVHGDHSGLAAELAGVDRRIYMSRIDLEYLRGMIAGQHRQTMHFRYLSEGFPEQMIDRVEKTNPVRIYALNCIDGRFNTLDNGVPIKVGEYRLQTVLVPGHTPGNMIAYANVEILGN